MNRAGSTQSLGKGELVISCFQALQLDEGDGTRFYISPNQSPQICRSNFLEAAEAEPTHPQEDMANFTGLEICMGESRWDSEALFAVVAFKALQNHRGPVLGL